MTPYESAAKAFIASGCEWSFPAFVEAHAFSGFVFITPDAFLMGRPVNRDWSKRDIMDPTLFSSSPDCWHCSLFAGDLARIPALVPYPLPFVSFTRRGKLRVFTWEQFKRLAGSRSLAVE